ncbi:Endocytosis regulator [Gnomoniopsis sp. IMI 355080]|nr:Endocytosis regulator [Gnomoniopsis sp. IMI 355080]
MPHRVAAFLRNSTNSFENQVNQVIHLKKSNVRSRTKSPHAITAGGVSDGPSRSSERVASYPSSINDEMDEPSPLSDSHTTNPHSSAPAVGRIAESPRLRPKLDGHDKDHHHHRLSFPGLHLGRSHKDQHSNPHAQISWKIESPPIIFHGDAENSTGALVSGQLYLDIKDDAGYEIDSFKATLNIRVTQKKPFTVHCHECTHQFTQIKEWTFLSHPGVPLHKGVHPFPFSVLLDGHLPATLDSPLVNITYEFKAEAIPLKAASPSIKLEKVFDVKRSLPPPELPHHSVRVFPPTNVKASVHYQQVIHPIGTNNLTMRLDGIARINPGTSTVEYWKLKKLTWRLEESLKTIAPACDKHKPANPTNAADEQQKRGMARTETRIIGEKTLFSGWKSSYAGPTDSNIELELDYTLNKHAKYSCDLKSRDGTEVSHQLMLEMVVSQECAPVGKPGLVTQTGVGRILRMHFGTILTERGGIGISWDNEAPPIYQDVPPSPPAYCEDLVGTMDGLPDIMESLDAAPGPSGTGSGYASGRSSGRNSLDGGACR